MLRSSKMLCSHIRFAPRRVEEFSVTKINSIQGLHTYKQSFLPAELVTKQGETLKIEIATAEEHEECCEFVQRNFFPVAPLDVLTQCDETQDSTFIEPLLADCIQSGVSLVVRNSQKRIVAVRMSEVSEKSEPRTVPNLDRFDFAILKALSENLDVFTLLNTEKLLHFVLMAVDQTYAQQGLAAKLLALSIELAKSVGAGGVVMEAVSGYAARAAIKNGFKIVNTVDYSTFEFHGKIPLADKRELLAEHSKAYLLVRVL